MSKKSRVDRFISQADDITITGGNNSTPPMDVRYDKWRVPTDEELHKEWLYEHNKMPGYLRTNKYNDEAVFVDAVRNGTIKRLPASVDDKMGRRSHCATMEELDDLLSTYASAKFRVGMPTRILNGFVNGDAIPMPIVFARGSKTWIVGGNTRLDVARIVKLTPDPKVIVVEAE